MQKESGVGRNPPTSLLTSSGFLPGPPIGQSRKPETRRLQEIGLRGSASQGTEQHRGGRGMVAGGESNRRINSGPRFPHL